MSSDDADFRLTDALVLPTFEIQGVRLLRRLTLLARANRIEHCFYPVFPPDADAEQVLGWLRGGRPRTMKTLEGTVVRRATPRMPRGWPR